MKCLSTIETESAVAPVASDMRLPMGLLGFEQIKEYPPLANAAAAKQVTKLAKQILLQQPAAALSARSQQLPQRELPLLS